MTSADYPLVLPLAQPPASVRSSVAVRTLLLLSISSSIYGLGCGDTLDTLEGGGGADFESIYASDEFQTCSGCHAPGAPGITEDIETTQDWSTIASARRTLRGNASGMIGNNAGCNGVPLLGSSSGQSLLVAAFDDDVRANFERADHPDCTGDAIADQTLKIGGALPSGLLQDLKDWIDAGAP